MCAVQHSFYWYRGSLGDTGHLDISTVCLLCFGRSIIIIKFCPLLSSEWKILEGEDFLLFVNSMFWGWVWIIYLVFICLVWEGGAEDGITQFVQVVMITWKYLWLQHSVGLPDVHSGYGFAIGNMAAFDTSDPQAVVSPGTVFVCLWMRRFECTCIVERQVYRFTGVQQFALTLQKVAKNSPDKSNLWYTES